MVVVVVDDEDVVVVGWQTEMFTVPPLASSWPEPGLWLSTVAGRRAVGTRRVGGRVGDQPGSADGRLRRGWPTDPRLRAPWRSAGDHEVDGAVGWRRCVRSGVLRGHHAVAVLARTSIGLGAHVETGAAEGEPADAGVCPTTLGTVTDVWVPDTVNSTFVEDLTLSPAAGFWARTVPMGLLLVTYLTV